MEHTKEVELHLNLESRDERVPGPELIRTRDMSKSYGHIFAWCADTVTSERTALAVSYNHGHMRTIPICPHLEPFTTGGTDYLVPRIHYPKIRRDIERRQKSRSCLPVYGLCSRRSNGDELCCLSELGVSKSWLPCPLFAADGVDHE